MKYKDKIPISQIQVEKAPASKQRQESLALFGQRQPIKLIELKQKVTGKPYYRIIDGRRRVLDMKRIGKTHVSGFVFEPDEMDEEEIRLDALTLNSSEPNHLDEAEHIKYLIDHCGYTVEDIASAVNLSTTTIFNRIDLLKKLLPEYQDLLRSGYIKVSAAYELIKLSHREQKLVYNDDVFSVKKITKKVKEIRSNRVNLIGNLRNLNVKSNNGKVEEESLDIGPGLFIEYEKVKKVLKGEIVEVEYDGKKYMLTLEKAS